MPLQCLERFILFIRTDFGHQSRPVHMLCFAKGRRHELAILSENESIMTLFYTDGAPKIAS
jgi:hypothetical protein